MLLALTVTVARTVGSHLGLIGGFDENEHGGTFAGEENER